MRNEITEVIDRSDFDPTWTDSHGARVGDPWGNAMGLMFDLCAYIYAETEHIPPSEWGYHPGANLGAELEEVQEYKPHLYAALERADVDTLMHTGNVLSRYCDLLERNGLPY